MTSYFSGKPDTADLDAVAERMKRVMAHGADLGADELVLPANAVAPKHLVAPLIAMVERSREERAIAAVMGALGAAAVLGSDLARDHLVSIAGPAQSKRLAEAIEKGRTGLPGKNDGPWDTDAYHGTLDALRHLLEPAADTAPSLLRSNAWRWRALPLQRCQTNFGF